MLRASCVEEQIAIVYETAFIIRPQPRDGWSDDIELIPLTLIKT